QGDGAQTLVKKAGWTSDFAAQRQRLVEAGLDQVVAAARKNLDDLLARQQALMGCGTSAAEPGCAVSVRFLQQASRVKPKEQVFALLAIGFALAEVDPRVVGVNLVSPEDSPVALADYTLHMEMIRSLALTSPKAGIALHAGELVLGLVPPDDLRFHIRQAVEIAGAKRIGHGVAVMEEDQPLALLDEMARRNVLVEINLTSNDSILGVKGAAHPFPVYRAQGVPVTLSTDDEGVSRNDLSREYQRAIETYDLSYGEMKEISRNGLEYSFLGGPSLWRSTRPFQTVEACANLAAPSCQSYVGTSDKARRQRDLEQAWEAFDRRLWPVME
ncbi:MAG: adenosine deaminase, partial [Rhodospirillales bacterium]|nr:adenosine deaminase [Rhodospirillales bacterium]